MARDLDLFSVLLTWRCSVRRTLTRPWRIDTTDDPERGSASILMLAVSAGLVVVALAVAVLAGTSAARTRAQSAADLAVLAAATAAMYASAVPCDLAAETARRNGAELGSCTGEGAGVYLVSVRVSAPAGRTAAASARAGPVSAAP